MSSGRSKYWSVGFSGKIKGTFLIHRIIWIIFNGKIPDDHDIDHIDQNSSNNNILNLRCISKSLNMRNKSLRNDNKTGKTGICFIDNPKSSGYVAYYKTLGGKNKSRYYSIYKYGEKEAKELAIKWYNEQNLIEEGYTTIHGKINE